MIKPSLHLELETISLRGDEIRIGGVVYVEGTNNNGSVKELRFERLADGRQTTVSLPTQMRLELSSDYTQSDFDYSDGGFRATTVALTNLLGGGDYAMSIVVHLGEDVYEQPLRVNHHSLRSWARPSTTPTHSFIPYYHNQNLRLRITAASWLRDVAAQYRWWLQGFMYEIAILVVRGRPKAFLVMQIYRVVRRRLAKQHIWLIGERKDTAQDNSYHLFAYIRANQLAPHCYYVIDKQSKDYDRVARLGGVIQFGSLRHTLYLLACEKSINSYSERNMYTAEYQQVMKCHPEWRRNKRYYLRHGVTGLTSISQSFNKSRADYSLFVVSSESEKQLYVREYGYDEKDVAVTGLARWDQLEDKSTGHTVLFMPTWRRWINSTQQLIGSDFYHQCLSLLTSPSLHQVLDDADLTLVFYPHYRIQTFMPPVTDIHPRVRIVHQNEQTVQSLLMRSDLLITDYSSVAFDFSYMSKPVVFYQFDDEKFYTRHNPPGPLSGDKLFGVLVKKEDAVVDCVSRFASGDSDFIAKAKTNPYIFRAPGQHTRLNYEAILAR